MSDPEARFKGHDDQPVVVASFLYPWEAEVACARLRQEGLSPALGDENLVNLDWFMSQAVGGIKVVVPESEAEQASRILEEAELSESNLASEAELAELVPTMDMGLPENDDPEDDLRCPRCGSSNLTFHRWSRAGFVGSFLLFGIPLPIPRPRWRCAACNGVWKKGEVE